MDGCTQIVKHARVFDVRLRLCNRTDGDSVQRERRRQPLPAADMTCEHDDTAPLGECLLHPLKMVDLDVFIEIALVQHGHRKNIEDVACHIDKGRANKAFCLPLGDTERGHHVLHRAAAHLRDQQIVEVAEHPPCAEQNGTRRAARKITEKHECIIEHCRTSFLHYCAAPSVSV